MSWTPATAKGAVNEQTATLTGAGTFGANVTNTNDVWTINFDSWNTISGHRQMTLANGMTVKGNAIGLWRMG